mgnify:CR=1 FL=1
MVDSVSEADAGMPAIQGVASSSSEGPVLSDTVIVPQGGEVSGYPAPELEQLPGIIEPAQSMLEIGGPVVLVLLLMSFVALTIVIMKLIQFGWLRIGNTHHAAKSLTAWRDGDVPEALGLVLNRRNPVAQVMAQALNGQQSNLPEAKVREEVLRAGSDILFQLRRGFRPLEVIGSIAPLLGLLGTVMGMIKAFQQLEAAGNQVNPAILSGGIWEALLTTAVGLCVAIPVVVMLNWLERRVDHLAHDMDNLVTQVFTEDLLSIGTTHRRDAAVQNGQAVQQDEVAGFRAGAVQTA